MKIIKKAHKNAKKIFFIKSILIVFWISLLFSSISFEDIANNQMYYEISERFKKDNFFREENLNCDIYDPIFLMAERLKKKPITICKNKESRHICFQNSKYSHYNKNAKSKYGIICESENFILDPFKSRQTKYIYKGPVDKSHRGAPILSKGFFDMKCVKKRNYRGYHKIYKNYFDSWNYHYERISKNFPELAPGKTVLLISRNQDSPNLFHGASELMNTISIMYLFNLKPENIQIILLESMKLENDPYYDLYKNLISRGGEPIYIRNLHQKYHISSAIHIPINWDSPLFLKLKIPRGYPDCKYPTQSYNILNNLINKYLIIPNYNDSFISDKDNFYYPESVIYNSKLNNIFNKTITIQWRKVWPRGRVFQKRILGNGIELADKLALALPKNYLIRLINTASLTIIEQISLMRKTDLLIGVHGAGITLAIFMPSKSILYEFLPKENNKDPIFISSLSGHKTYSIILKSKHKIINKNEVLFFNSNEFVESVLRLIKENNF